MNTLTNSIEIWYKAILSSASLGNVVLSVSVQSILALINGLQIIVMTALFNLKIPDNMRTIFVKALAMANFDLFQTEKLYQETFGFEEESDSFNGIFDASGF